MISIINRFLNSITYVVPTIIPNECYLVDCGDIDSVIKMGWHVKGVFITHCHIDHIYGINRLIEHFPQTLVYTNMSGLKGMMNSKLNFSKYHEELGNFRFLYPHNCKFVNDNETLCLDENFTVKTIFTPGHDISCISYLINEYFFTGDSYIPGIKTVTTFPKSNKKDAKESLEKILEIKDLGNFTICPGHKI